ncbi:MAG: signal peptidase I [Candidatus Levybacteria bacterium RIFCSPHIGHO2_12_FULL_38_12]|nr:MAG: signal peptidase I [Candidatus Levybacteria bacterium RIFCSPHIGHO2_02_FULL_37_18]OGH22502.1 MAG: signal peptidase I [Candidatus Levybacteria bacterium RIFCSPHIGHO2_12_FULL_38_12]OGH33462.1 MAG: signal peptidase I [Candidatus Levybacteria bacterium RIFCSPLOWO2_01_FULL_37_20]OGH44039.1 MAG: signal peptidase I [Candidatus Levybacteria bacterium RIFCSPLOWO2_02_FULL_37_18]OGH52451.1 MAG: signal peptidase I [Candidatus Levybacteria bacterium RIFCSPLOWO2_12_FULL_37_7]
MFILHKIFEFLLDTIQTILLAASVFLVIYIFIARPFQVSGQSMYSTFKDGEYVLTNLITLRFETPVKGDVIVFKAPNDPDKDYIKRIIATEGDNVFIKDGFVYLNNQKLDESKYLQSNVRTYGESFLTEGKVITVDKDEFFVLGDNRPASSDSREFKPIKLSSIIGKSMFVYWPPNAMRWVKNPYYN